MLALAAPSAVAAAFSESRADAGTIASQVATRRLARAACAVAGLRVTALPPSEDAGALFRPLADANAAWNGIPAPPPPPASSSAPSP